VKLLGRLPPPPVPDGDAEGDADADTDAEAEVDGVGEPPLTLPVHVVPFRAKLDGTGLLPLHAPLNPKLVLAPVDSEPLYDTLLTTTFAPDWVKLPFHSCVIVCPAPNDQVSCQLLIGLPRFVMLTLAPKPPCHWLVTE